MPDRVDSLPRAQPAKAWQQCVVPEGIRVRLVGGLDDRNVSMASFPAGDLHKSTANLSYFHAAL
jgi:hypothetical protein